MASIDCSVNVNPDEIDMKGHRLWDYKEEIEAYIDSVGLNVEAGTDSSVAAGKDISLFDNKARTYLRNNENAPHKVLCKSLESYVEWLHYVADAYRTAGWKCCNLATRITTYDFRLNLAIYNSKYDASGAVKYKNQHN